MSVDIGRADLSETRAFFEEALEVEGDAWGVEVVQTRVGDSSLTNASSGSETVGGGDVGVTVGSGWWGGC